MWGMQGWGKLRHYTGDQESLVVLALPFKQYGCIKHHLHSVDVSFPTLMFSVSSVREPQLRECINYVHIQLIWIICFVGKDFFFKSTLWWNYGTEHICKQLSVKAQWSFWTYLHSYTVLSWYLKHDECFYSHVFTTQSNWLRLGEDCGLGWELKETKVTQTHKSVKTRTVSQLSLIKLGGNSWSV